MSEISSEPSLGLIRRYLPTLAAVIACAAGLPASEWFARAITPSHSIPEVAYQGKAESELYELRGEPILPVPIPGDLDRQKVALGRALFHEPGLSRTGEVSCASCHIIDEGGDDNLESSEGVGGALGEMNAPTVLNASLNFRQFWDGRAATLEEQVKGPLHNPLEMGTDWESLLSYLKHSEVYSEWFARVFEDGLSQDNFVAAIVEYERSLVTPNSAFDRWLKGDDHALHQQALAGYALFKEFQCIGCHQGVNVGGNLFQPLGVMLEYYQHGANGKKHLGRFNVTNDVRDRNVFKVPSLRNVARTAPYFHDGSVESLEEAVGTMARYQLGVPIEEQEIAAICAFLQSLSANPSEDEQ